MIEWVSTKWNKNYEIVTGFQHLEHTGTQNQVSHLKIVSKPPQTLNMQQSKHLACQRK